MMIIAEDFNFNGSIALQKHPRNHMFWVSGSLAKIIANKLANHQNVAVNLNVNIFDIKITQ